MKWLKKKEKRIIIGKMEAGACLCFILTLKWDHFSCSLYNWPIPNASMAVLEAVSLLTFALLYNFFYI